MHDEILVVDDAAKRCLNLHAFAKAELHLSNALKINDESVEALNLSGVLAESVKEYDRARKYYRRAIRIDGSYEPAQQNMRGCSNSITSV
jgi:Tfp pilus assembly protein PilF